MGQGRVGQILSRGTSCRWDFFENYRAQVVVMQDILAFILLCDVWDMLKYAFESQVEVCAVLGVPGHSKSAAFLAVTLTSAVCSGSKATPAWNCESSGTPTSAQTSIADLNKHYPMVSLTHIQKNEMSYM